MATTVLAGPVTRDPGRTAEWREIHKRFDGRTLYLCCTLRFHRDGTATDANLRYPFANSIVSAGTSVQVEVFATRQLKLPAVNLRPVGSDRTFSLRFQYGGPTSEASGYFKKILLESDPGPLIQTQPEEMRTAILKGKLKIGMTRRQAVLARGYPPGHQTPNLDADEWIYYTTNGLVESVRFTDGRVTEIESGPAP